MLKKEIERKFLVQNFFPQSNNFVAICQGYLQIRKDRTIRVRTVESSKKMVGYLTIKKSAENVSISRDEFEIEIPLTDAEYLLSICQYPLIEKTRYFISFGDFTWEIDKFCGLNEGLILAEIELERIDQPFAKPDFVGREVTDDKRYYNALRAQNPFQAWEKSER
ncbi:MAG: CYTH domain-containing protein [Candidatus Marinimicrobia bacterium]|nr:CYTH domain-containing protein [Candidatus Neomarinimicrobiota bacterium]